MGWRGLSLAVLFLHLALWGGRYESSVRPAASESARGQSTGDGHDVASGARVGFADDGPRLPFIYQDILVDDEESDEDPEGRALTGPARKLVLSPLGLRHPPGLIPGIGNSGRSSRSAILRC